MSITNEIKRKNKLKFLDELKSSIAEIEQATSYSLASSLPLNDALGMVKKAGGKRPGAGAPKKVNIAMNRTVKLTDEEYQLIIKKYGTFTKGVKSLLTL